MKRRDRIGKRRRRAALCAVLREAILHARGIAGGRWPRPVGEEGSREGELAALMQAIHNIPMFLSDLKGWDDTFFRDYSLRDYDDEWAKRSGLCLTKIYDAELRSDAEKEAAVEAYHEAIFYDYSDDD